MELDPTDIAGGIALIDAQHAEIIEHVRRTAGATVILLADMDVVDRYIARHFTVEEEYMRCFDYPAMADHIAEHEAFRAHARDLRRQMAGGPVDMSRTIQGFITRWLTRHLAGADRALSAFLVARGIR